MPVAMSRGAQRAPRRSVVVIAATLMLGVFLTFAPTAAASWSSSSSFDVERYYLRLLNCTRTGGHVRSDGTC